jgi:hypothetical protein
MCHLRAIPNPEPMGEWKNSKYMIKIMMKRIRQVKYFFFIAKDNANIRPLLQQM